MNALNDQFEPNEDIGVLRFITAGSVDDGKSTLIGRLLYDSKGVYADQMQAIGNSRYSRTRTQEVDLSLLTDGLEAEREQGITIDVAYRYFATSVRKFIVADAPGHEQYTRNMVTGASTAQAAIILVDAAKAADGQLLVQTRRHSAIAQLLGIRHIILAINKLDLLDWDQATYERIKAAYTELAAGLGITQFHVLPLSALKGDNVVHASQHMAWYQGPTLLQLLETLDVTDQHTDLPLRFPVQWVARHGGNSVQGLRAYAGQVASGAIRVGDPLVVQPAGTSATVGQLLTYAGPVMAASAGTAITVVLNEDVDVSRGDTLSHAEQPPTLTSEFNADICWLDTTALNLKRKYIIKHGTRLSSARIKIVHTRRDVHKLDEHRAEGQTLQMNDIGHVAVVTAHALAVDDYRYLPANGAFILIDEATNQTVAGGMIRI